MSGGRTRRILRQSFASITRNAGRALFTAVGIALGVAVLVTTLGWSQTVTAVVNTNFDETLATRILVKSNSSTPPDPVYRSDFDDVVLELPGVEGAGLIGAMAELAVSRSGATMSFPGIAVTQGALDASAATVSGRWFDEATLATGQPMVVLGGAVARDLGITADALPTAVEVAGVTSTVLGIVEDPGNATGVRPGGTPARATPMDL